MALAVAFLISMASRCGQYGQATERSSLTGDPTSNDPIIVTGIRPRAHDVIFPITTLVASQFYVSRATAWADSIYVSPALRRRADLRPT